jgi:glucose/arabinose dehydrogenase
MLLVACQSDESSDTSITASIETRAIVGENNRQTPAPEEVPSISPDTTVRADIPEDQESQPETGPQTETRDDPVIAETARSISPTPTLKPVTPSPTATAALQELPVSEISLVPILDGFQKPTFLTHANDDRLFITEESGRIWTAIDGQKLSEPFLDISARVRSEELEQGLLSIAFHPHFVDNGYFYVNYTGRGGETVVSRFEVRANNPNLANPDSELIIMTLEQPYANHNGGQLQFGPDGFLYIGMGDGGSGGDPDNNGQNPLTLLGSMLRIDVDGQGPYSIPEDNPFVADDSIPNEIWAIGLRNPWRFSFDRFTGDIYIADVGQNQWEEINHQLNGVQGGVNYGWNVLEGNHCYNRQLCDSTGFVMPIAEYSHLEGACSITGGYVYRGSDFPTLKGNYFFADYCLGIVWSLYHQGGNSWLMTQVAQLRANISSFGEDNAGELYLLDHSGGVVYRLQPATE